MFVLSTFFAQAMEPKVFAQAMEPKSNEWCGNRLGEYRTPHQMEEIELGELTASEAMAEAGRLPVCVQGDAKVK
jgi:hypothetical protein